MSSTQSSFIVDLFYAIFIHWFVACIGVFIGFFFGRMLPRDELVVIAFVLLASFIAGWIIRRRLKRMQILLAVVGATAIMSIVPFGFFIEYLNSPHPHRNPAIMLLAIVPILISAAGAFLSGLFEQSRIRM